MRLLLLVAIWTNTVTGLNVPSKCGKFQVKINDR